MFKNILRVLSANGVVAVIGLISSLYLPKILTIDDYATYQTFILYMSYIAILHLGFPTGMNIKYAGKNLENVDKSQYKAEIRIILVILSFFSCLGLIIYIATKQEMLLYISIMVFLYCFLGSFSLLMQAFGKFKVYAVLHILMSAIPLIIPIAYYYLFHSASAKLCILAYIIVYAVTTIGCLGYHHGFVGGVNCARLITGENWNTEKLGISFLLGNYINSLFHSIDKQFVKWFCITSEFSYYSFGLTMQSTMTIFITAVSQPLFPYMAAGKLKGPKQFSTVKRFLLMLGSVSGLAYFACALVVTHWIPDYSYSLPVIRVYFAVFPAMAVINCLYFNLYKIKKMTRRYIIDLLVLLVAAAIANYIAVQMGYGYVGVAFATTVLNYIWLVYGSFIFKELKLDVKEIVFIILFLAEFLLVPRIDSILLGAVTYLISDLFISILCFRNELGILIKKYVGKTQSLG